jgi:nitrogen fixation protein FixH
VYQVSLHRTTGKPVQNTVLLDPVTDQAEADEAFRSLLLQDYINAEKLNDGVWFVELDTYWISHLDEYGELDLANETHTLYCELP